MFLTYFLITFFIFYQFFFKRKFFELHNPSFKYSHKDKTIYDNPIIKRKLPDELFFQFTDLQAKIAIKTFNKNLNYGLKKRQYLAKILYENLNQTAKKYIPDEIIKYSENCFWHFPIILDSEVTKNFQIYLMNKGYDVVGYGLKLCSSENAFESYNSQLISAKLIHENTLFLPLFDNLNEFEMKKIAKNINDFFI